MAKGRPAYHQKLPVESDVSHLLATLGKMPTANLLDQTIGDLALIAFYYLLRVGKYTIKATRNHTKQTVQFRMQDVTFFKHDSSGTLRQLRRQATDATILTAHSTQRHAKIRQPEKWVEGSMRPSGSKRRIVQLPRASPGPSVFPHPR